MSANLEEAVRELQAQKASWLADPEVHYDPELVDALRKCAYEIQHAMAEREA